ncbi:MAG: hypothetical protein PHV34_18075 [Verrucomicrobiae bacterium]|nr:hypothetical protein [Verrucomicrobiae bacterium]
MDSATQKLPPPPPKTDAPFSGEDAIFIPLDGKTFYAWFAENSRHYPAQAQPLVKSFRKNLEGAGLTVFMPMLVAVGMRMRSRYEELRAAERVSRGVKGNTPCPEASAAAKAQFTKEIDDPDRREQWTNAAIEYLSCIYQSKQYETAAFSLLRQGVAQAWETLETLVIDCISTLAARDAALSNRLTHDPHTKDLVHFFSTDSAAQPALKNGPALLINLQASNAVEQLKHLFRVTFPGGGQLQMLLNRRELEILNQRRLLIRHRSGTVDTLYREQTGDQAAEGTEVMITSGELKGYLCTVRDIGIEILKETSELIARK